MNKYTGYTQQEQEKIEEYMERERSVTLALAGLTEERLTKEQQDALTHYVQAQTEAYLNLYGPNGPRGNALRMETDAESTARWEWEDAIKPPYQRLLERVEEFAHTTWRELNQNDEMVHVQVYEEESEQQLAFWREYYPEFNQETRLFQARLEIGYGQRDCLTVEVWIIWQPEADTLEALQCRCMYLLVDGLFYWPTTLTAEARAEILVWPCLQANQE